MNLTYRHIALLLLVTLCLYPHVRRVAAEDLGQIEASIERRTLRPELGFRSILASHGDPRPPRPGVTQGVVIESMDIPLFDREQMGGPLYRAASNAEKLAMLDAQLAQWASEGFNAVIWLGENEFWYPGAHRILRHEKYPEARELSTEENEECIQYMKDVFALAKKHGLKNFLYTLSIWYTPAFAEAHGLLDPMEPSMTVSISQKLGWVGGFRNCGVRNELTNNYAAAIFQEVVDLYDDLDGFYTPLGECVPGQRSTYFGEAIAPGLNAAKRDPLIIINQWQVPFNDYMRDIASRRDYKNVWLSFHGFNSEQIVDPHPYPSLQYWAEGTGLPTIAVVYPSNVQFFPFNSPRFAYEMTQNMKRTLNTVGYIYWEFPVPELSYLFRGALARYAASDEPYSDEPWLDEIEKRFGDREAAAHFLEAFNLSARVIPEANALIYTGNDVYPREVRLPYEFTVHTKHPFAWTTARVKGVPIVPIFQYAQFVAQNRGVYEDNNGRDPERNHFSTSPVWRTEGGSVYDMIPSMQMANVCKLAEEALAAAEAGLPLVKENKDEAQRMRDFMEAYVLMSRYWQLKVAASTEAQVYALTHKPEDKQRAEELADQTVEAYIVTAEFMRDRLNQSMKDLYNRPFEHTWKRLDLDGLIEAEKQERETLSTIFGWPE